MMETKQLTILKALENIHIASKKSKLELNSYNHLQDEIGYLSNCFQTNETQSIILASFISLSCLEEVELIEVIKYFEMEKIEFLQYVKHLQVLQDKNILGKKSNRNFSREDYFLKPHLIQFIVENKPIPKHLIKTDEKEDSFNQFLAEIDLLSNKKDIKEIDYRVFTYEFKELLNNNKKYKLVDFALKNLDPIDSFVFFDVIIDAISENENNFQSSLQTKVDDFTNQRRETFTYMSKFLEGKTKLNILNLIEKDKSRFSNRHKIQLTEKAVKMLYKMEGLKFGYVDNKNEKLIYPNKIQKTNLYYNPSEQEQLVPVMKSMGHKFFSDLQKIFQQKNMPSGISVLLYGSPGTGKTETVYQLAKKYNRPIFKVDISETKSMWFGESQKLVKKIFTDYYEYKIQEKICPILLFNEADAVIGKRKSAGSSPVSDTENAIQNILLEELENFEGILFATSNLVDNLDKAFERRFLFKIKFDTPSQENAAKIWKNKIPLISKKEADILASKFRFSGGEMENIARKCIMEDLVYETKIDFERIVSFCENEKWNTKTKKSIGF